VRAGIYMETDAQTIVPFLVSISLQSQALALEFERVELVSKCSQN
jgi:hypothetical protein